jgi:hypothetical protein
MVLIQSRYFTTADGRDPTGCSIDDTSKLKVEILAQSDWTSQQVHEEVYSFEVRVARVDTGVTVKTFRWTGLCAMRWDAVRQISTPVFGPLPIGDYIILTGSQGAPLSKSLGECGINLIEVSS